MACLFLALAAAGPMRRPSLPIPPIPPAHGPPDRAAPVPDPTMLAPRDAPTAGVTLEPEFFSLRYYNQSGGYTPGSQVEAQPTRRPPLAPGLQINVPLP